VPTMPWWDPAVASGCLAAASGDPGLQSTMGSEAMLEQGPEAQEDVASSREEVAPADPHSDISTVSLLPWCCAPDLLTTCTLKCCCKFDCCCQAWMTGLSPMKSLAITLCVRQLCIKTQFCLCRTKMHSMTKIAPSAVTFHLCAKWQPVTASATSGIMRQLLPDLHASRRFEILCRSGSDL